MIIRSSTLTDLEKLMRIFEEARMTISKLGIDQWQNGYPSESVIEADVKKGQSFCVLRDDICATFALILDGEPTYDKIYDGHWLTGDDSKNYLAIHRVAISVSSRGSGVSGEIISFAAKKAQSLGRESLRIDTHEGNVVMRRMLEKNGFKYCGVIYLESGEARVAYEKPLCGEEAYAAPTA